VRGGRFGLVVAVLAAAAIVSAAVVGLGIYFAPSPPSPTYPSTDLNVSLNSSGMSTPVPSNFLGVDLQATFSVSGPQGAAVTSSGIHLVRWPGGGLADRLDPLAANGSGLIYGGGGKPLVPATTAADFVLWCRSAGCQPIISLPGEIDEPSRAAAEVTYFVHALGFHPAYWEIGNEPGLWSHFGVDWTNWAPNQTAAPTPDQYAAEVASYIGAIRSVDTTTPIIGLPGIGTGGSDEPAWIAATVTANGPNISAVAIHVYPAGSNVGSGPLGEFFSGLTGSSGLPTRVAQDRAAIQVACPSCQIGLLVDEIAVASGLTQSTTAGFAWIPFEAAEIIQALQTGVAGLGFWVAQGSYPGSWVSTGGSFQAIYSLFSPLLSPLPAVQLPVTVTSSAGEVFAIALGGNTSSPSLVVVVDANATLALRVSLAGLGLSSTPGELWTWSNTSASPQGHSWGPASPPRWTIPPASVLVWRASTG